MDQDLTPETLITLTSDIVAAHVSNNAVKVGDVATLINSIYAALAGLGTSVSEELPPEPAVPVRSSVKPDYIVCLEDGKKLKMLKRHLMTHYNMTPDDYRKRWNLPADYPMVSPNYAAKRRELALKIGLGRKATQPAPEPAPAKPAPRKAATGKMAATKANATKAAPRKAAAPKATTDMAPASQTAPTKRAPARKKQAARTDAA
ncbi:MucR family transcriptional regulator [Croceicoccus ponticola]|uniref:MucR family transcriptional regulator n=1 Tax=Croceicoccus ponticola TaxID=2217664 RepID=A0A437GUB1_9SPHN|nr:MucR family transcriptional regulator [Croceicoccus ponticola]